MFKSLFRNTRLCPKDPWAGVGTLYIAQYEKQFEDIAAKISREGPTIHVRFNPKQKCAEFYNLHENVVAKVKVHGEMGMADEAIVTFFLLPESAKQTFTHTLPLRVKFETIL